MLLAIAGANSVAAETAPASPAPYWRPKLSDTWQWQLSGTLNTSYTATVYDIDLFDTSADAIQALQTTGKKVICYFSAGSAESWRHDFDQFQSADIGLGLDEWPDERWLDTRSANVRKIMQARLMLAARKGCNGVEPDNVDAYANQSGLPLTYRTQLDYNRFLAAEAHELGLSIGLKNNIDQLVDLVAYFDFAINEQCHQYKECDGYKVFIKQGKPVFNAEYTDASPKDTKVMAALCASSKKLGIRTLVLPLELDDSCRLDCIDY